MKKFITVVIVICIVFLQTSIAQNVGIGTTQPGAQLHIASTDVLDTARGTILLSRYWADQANTRSSAIYHIYKSAVGKDQLVFGVSGDGGEYTSPILSANARMVIQATGTVGIGTVTPNSSTLLDLSSNTKGFLPPRMTMAERNAITTPATGLIVYCLDCTPAAPYSFNGTIWTSMTASATPTYTIGQAAQGGIVFWVDETGQHGLVAATSDQNGGGNIQWYNGTYTNTKAIRMGISSGAYNTDRINDNQGSGVYAAAIAAQYNGGEFGDWYLPSIGELNLMFLQKNTIGGFANDSYWSSSELNPPPTGTTISYFAWVKHFLNGAEGHPFKNDARRVRAIRRF